ncbi:unnamed protein product [Rotaria sp. Silwood2]|nr:unnamed protein product [Rotaria sp. Silwood2]CAF4306360.1 unnamed protein product [Rotaria sp. Silwood2]
MKKRSTIEKMVEGFGTMKRFDRDTINYKKNINFEIDIPPPPPILHQGPPPPPPTTLDNPSPQQDQLTGAKKKNIDAPATRIFVFGIEPRGCPGVLLFSGACRTRLLCFVVSHLLFFLFSHALIVLRMRDSCGYFGGLLIEQHVGIHLTISLGLI